MVMWTQLFSRLKPARPAAALPRRRDAVAVHLMEVAEARAGRSARDAAELRRAALAYLGVVR